MTLSTGPWWWAPVLALGWMTTVPAQSFSAPARARVIAAARLMPGVWGVLMSSSLECTTRTPSCFHFRSGLLIPVLWSRHAAVVDSSLRRRRGLGANPEAAAPADDQPAGPAAGRPQSAAAAGAR